jgi:hypothetical protein
VRHSGNPGTRNIGTTQIICTNRIRNFASVLAQPDPDYALAQAAAENVRIVEDPYELRASLQVLSIAIWRISR